MAVVQGRIGQGGLQTRQSGGRAELITEDLRRGLVRDDSNIVQKLSRHCRTAENKNNEQTAKALGRRHTIYSRYTYLKGIDPVVNESAYAL